MFCEELFPSFVHWPWWSQYTHPPPQTTLAYNIHHTIAIWYIYSTNVLWCLIILRVQSKSKQWLATSGLGSEEDGQDFSPFEDVTASEQKALRHACYNNGRPKLNKNRPNCTTILKKSIWYIRKNRSSKCRYEKQVCAHLFWLATIKYLNLQPSSESISTFRLWTFCVAGMPCIRLSASWYCDCVH